MIELQVVSQTGAAVAVESLGDILILAGAMGDWKNLVSKLRSIKLQTLDGKTVDTYLKASLEGITDGLTMSNSLRGCSAA